MLMLMRTKLHKLRRILVQLGSTPGYCIWLIGCVAILILIVSFMVRWLGVGIVDLPESTDIGSSSLHITLDSPVSSLLAILLGFVAWYFIGLATKRGIEYVAGKGYNATHNEQVLKYLGLVVGCIATGFGLYVLMGVRGLGAALILLSIAMLSFYLEEWALVRWLQGTHR